DRLVTPDLAFFHPHRPGPARGRLHLPALGAGAGEVRGGCRPLIGPHGHDLIADAARAFVGKQERHGAAAHREHHADHGEQGTNDRRGPRRGLPAVAVRSPVAGRPGPRGGHRGAGARRPCPPASARRAPAPVPAPVGAGPPWPSAARPPCCPACAAGIAVPGLAARARRPEMMTTPPPTAMSTPTPIRTSPRVFTSWILSLFVGL